MTREWKNGWEAAQEQYGKCEAALLSAQDFFNRLIILREEFSVPVEPDEGMMVTLRLINEALRELGK